MDKETLIKILQPTATVFSVLVAGLLAYIANWNLKRLENRNAEKKDKEKERLKYFIPLLRCLYELDDRFDRIFKNLHEDWLDSKYLDSIKNKQGFADNPKEKGYFIISSIYMIAYFFGVTEAIKKGIDTTKLSLDRKKSKGILNKIGTQIDKLFTDHSESDIFNFDPDITIICRLLQNKELFYKYMASKDFKNPKDANEIHKHIQHSIGEMMLEKDGDDGYRVKSFREFFDLYMKDDSFRFWFILIEGYFTDLAHFEKSKEFEKKAELKNDIRPLRLLAIQYWCRILMSNIAKVLEFDEMNFETRKPEEVFETQKISKDLKDLIIGYKLNNSETYLLGLKLNND